MQVIGQFSLIDRGGFNVKPEVNFTNPDGTSGRTGSYGEKLAGQSITFSPGAAPQIQNNATVQLYVDVVAGRDKTADESFNYQQGNGAIANYAISGITISPKLKFLGVTTSHAESESLAAAFLGDSK